MGDSSAIFGPVKNARNKRQQAIFSRVYKTISGTRLKRFSWRLKSSFLNMLKYRAFPQYSKKISKVHFNMVLMPLKGSFKRIGKNVQKSKKSETLFFGFFENPANFRALEEVF